MGIHQIRRKDKGTPGRGQHAQGTAGRSGWPQVWAVGLGQAGKISQKQFMKNQSSDFICIILFRPYSNYMKCLLSTFYWKQTAIQTFVWCISRSQRIHRARILTGLPDSEAQGLIQCGRPTRVEKAILEVSGINKRECKTRGDKEYLKHFQKGQDQIRAGDRTKTTS